MKLKQVLMQRDGLSAAGAEEEINDMRDRVLEGEDPEDVLADYGLEPDFVMELIP